MNNKISIHISPWTEYSETIFLGSNMDKALDLAASQLGIYSKSILENADKNVCTQMFPRNLYIIQENVQQ